MIAHQLNPILNVADMQQSFDWFAKLGWQKSWDWGTPPDFGAVCSGMCTIFLCLNDQGGRGGDAVWMSIWVDDVDAVHRDCLAQGIDVVWPPTDMPWNAREMHIRHPDGHVFRISRGVEETK